MILVDVDAVGVSRPERPLFADCSITLAAGDRLGIVGINGTGKSTLLRIIAGIDDPETGSVRRGRDVSVAVLDQAAELPEGTVLDVVEQVAPERPWEAAAVLDRLGLAGVSDRATSALSGGQAKRVALARALVAEADLLLLDEPTNHLDVDAIAWLEERLAAHRGGVVLVTHDRHVLDAVTTRVLELDRGRAHVHEGGYDAYLAGRAEREDRAAAAEASRRTLARQELAWLRRGAPARTRKSKAHLARARAVVDATPESAVRGAAPDLTAASVDGGPRSSGWAATRHHDTPRLGDTVVELHGVGHRFDHGPWLFRGLDLRLDPAERLGIVGPNGVGKSTLLEVLSGRLEPCEGTVVTGPTVALAHHDQLGMDLDPEQRVVDVVAGGRGDGDHRVAALLERFWFDADVQRSPVRLLSGGERRRLQLLLTLGRRPNVLLLDEPTNDLDLDTLRLVEDFLEDWPGALVVVSHDRAFLERTVTDVVVIEGDGTGRAGRRPGGYGAWEADRRRGRRSRRAGIASGPPTVGVAEASQEPDAVEAGGRGSDVGGEDDGSAQRAPTRAGRSPSTLRHLLREADKRMARLQRDRQGALAALEAAGEDHQALAAAGAALAELDRDLASVEDEWLALSEEVEATQAARRADRGR